MRYKLKDDKNEASFSSPFIIVDELGVVEARTYNKKMGALITKMLNNHEEWEEKSKKLKKPSDEFMQAFTDIGSTGVTCELCGRYHFTDQDEHSGEYSDEEWEKLLKEAETNPDEYEYHGTCGDDYISWGYIEGKQIVFDCPCHRARRYEDWIWSHRYMISDYLKRMAKKWIEEAKQVAGLSNIDTDNLVKEDLKIEGRIQRPHR